MDRIRGRNAPNNEIIHLIFVYSNWWRWQFKYEIEQILCWTVFRIQSFVVAVSFWMFCFSVIWGTQFSESFHPGRRKTLPLGRCDDVCAFGLGLHQYSGTRYGNQHCTSAMSPRECQCPAQSSKQFSLLFSYLSSHPWKLCSCKGAKTNH
jgi:hypothetical protein